MQTVLKENDSQKRRYVAGIDAGGSYTRCEVADERGCILSAGYGGPANKNFVSSRLAQRSVRRAFLNALKSIKQPINTVAIAGPHLPPEALDCISKRARTVIATDEFEASLAAGLRKTDGWGVVILSGTGSFCKGRNSHGKERYAGGWGPLIGDEGSGYDLAREALTALVKAWDGRGEPTMLTGLILSHLNIVEPAELRRKLYNPSTKRHKFAELAKHAFIAAEAGDKVAKNILRNGGRRLANLTFPVLEGLFKRREKFPLVLSGGILREKSILADTLVSEIKKGWPRADVLIPLLQPVTGAVIIALDSIGVSIDAGVIDNLNETGSKLVRSGKRGR